MLRTLPWKLKADTNPKGSNIWSLETINKDLIWQHSFWEVREGRMALFWEDSWQQREKLFSHLDLGEIFLFTKTPSRRTIKKYWC